MWCLFLLNPVVIWSRLFDHLVLSRQGSGFSPTGGFLGFFKNMPSLSQAVSNGTSSQQIKKGDATNGGECAGLCLTYILWRINIISYIHFIPGLCRVVVTAACATYWYAFSTYSLVFYSLFLFLLAMYLILLNMYSCWITEVIAYNSES